MKRWTVIAAGLLVLVLVPVWISYGALTPDEGGHGGMMMDSKKFMAKAQAYVKKHRLEDGSVMATTDELIPIVAFQWGFIPNKLKMKTGEHYELQFLSTDVNHSFSIHMGRSSLNVLLSPGSMTEKTLMPTRTGEYLFLCNQYCGVAHTVMRGRIIVEGKPIFKHDTDLENLEEEEEDHDEGKKSDDGDGDDGHDEKDEDEKEDKSDSKMDMDEDK